MENLDNLRIEIDKYDSQILNLLNKRMEACSKVGEFKKNNNIKVLDSERERKLLDNLISKNEHFDSKLDENFIKDLWTLIMNYSKSRQI